VTSTDNHTSGPTTSILSLNATVVAGIYHNLDISISDCKNSGSFCSQLTEGSPSGAPFSSSFNASFVPSTYVGTVYDADEVSLLDTAISSTSVGAYLLGSLFASGGMVTINADSLSGADH